MGLFSSITNAVKSLAAPALGIANGIGKMAGGVLNQLGLDKLVLPLAQTLGGIPGFGGQFGGLLKCLPDLLQGKLDLNDAIKIAAVFTPPPVGPVMSMVDLDNLTGSVLNAVGEKALDPNSTEGQNLLTAAQSLGFSLPI